MRRRIAVITSFVLGVLLFCGALSKERFLEKNSGHISVRCDKAGVTSGQIKKYYTQQQQKIKSGELGEVGETPDITIWKKTEQQTAANPSLGKTAEISLIEAWGDISVICPERLMQGTLPTTSDTKGCAISKGLAWELFGSEQVIGQHIKIEGNLYIIRGLLQMEDRIFVLQKEGTDSFPYVELSYTSKEPPASAAKQLLQTQFQLPNNAAVIEGSLYGGIARIFLFLPFWFLLILGLPAGIRCCRREILLWKKYGGILLITAGYCLAVWITIKFGICFTDDYIPSAWSDFAFWTEKWKEHRENQTILKTLIQLYRDMQIIEHTRESIYCSLGSTVTLAATFCLGRCRKEVTDK